MRMFPRERAGKRSGGGTVAVEIIITAGGVVMPSITTRD
jgi:hypothetical protein